jgi:hypothetical protein
MKTAAVWAGVSRRSKPLKALIGFVLEHIGVFFQVDWAWNTRPATLQCQRRIHAQTETGDVQSGAGVTSHRQ